MASVSMSSSSNIKIAEQNLDVDDDKSRLRVSKACTRCRTRKDRCDGLRPSCTPCKSADKLCAYEATTKKRGLPEGYVRGLERLLTLASHTIEGLEGVLIGYLHNEDVKKAWNSGAGDELYSSWKESRLYQELEGFLQNNAGVPGATGTKRKRVSEDDHADNPTESLNSVLNLLGAKKHRVVEDDESSVPTNGTSSSHERHEVSVGRSQEWPPNSRELLDLYFTHVHCWFPILDRPSVLKTYYAHSRKATQGQKLDGGQALLWAIFAYTTLLEASADDKANLSLCYSENALKHVPTPYTNAEDVEDFNVMHAQALIVLSLLRLGNGQWLGAWMCTARAARILLAIQPESKPMRGALQGCFILETLLNVHFDNPQPLFPSALIKDMMDEDGHEEWETWSSKGPSPSFALSIFNRLTRVFLVLNEAVSKPIEAKNPEYVQSKLTSIHNIAREHFNSGVSNPNLDSPPHHVYFQIGLLFAQLRLVSHLNEIHSPHFDLPSLAKNVLALFEICEKSSSIGLIRVPPLFADILNLAHDVAAEASSSFEPTAASPSYEDFVITTSSFRTRLASIWTSFESKRSPIEYLKKHHEVPLSAETNEVSFLGDADIQFSAHAINYPEFTNPPAPASVSNTSLKNQWTPQHISAASPAFSQTRHSFSNSSWPIPAPGQSMAFPGTSPSFAGDEVDAIFHEMAHLDTNEWSTERALGLKDFGFTDESAFMEFCNDPERLSMPVESNVPLSSNRQSWTFGAQPQ